MKVFFNLFLILVAHTSILAQTAIDTSSSLLPEAVISGNFPVYLQALEQQRSANGIVSVLNLDLPGRFPDLNPAEALQRLPGIVVERSQGEGRFVHIRGADPSFTTVQVNGEQIVTPEANHRFLQFDLLPIDQLKSVEVWKTNRPDQDGDAIGGSINMLTRKPAAGKSNWQSAIAVGYKPQAGLPNEQAQLSYTGKNLVINGSFWQDHRATDNLETVFGITEVGGNKTLTIQDLELRHFEISRRRIGLSAEYIFPLHLENTSAYLRGMYFDFDEKNLRQRLRYRPGAGIYSSFTDTIYKASVGRDIQFTHETERFAAFQSGFEHSLKSWKLDGSAAYSFGLESEPEGRQLEFLLPDMDLLQTDKSLRFPKFKVVNGEDEMAYNKFMLNELEAESDRSTDRAITLKANAQRQFQKANDYLKFGAKVRFRQKSTRAIERIYDQYSGTLPIRLTDLLEPVDRSFLGNKYAFGKGMQWDKTNETVDANLTGFQLNAFESAQESTAGNFDILENTGAAFVLANFELGAWKWLAGARLEHTQYSYTADQVIVDSLGQLSSYPSGRHFSGHYTYLLPSVQTKYIGKDGFQWQAAVSASYSRPSFDQLAPYELFNQLDGVVLAGNPTLKPAFSWNLDLAVEKPLSGGGSVSASLFCKHIKRFIFTQQSRDIRTWGGSPVNVVSTIPINGAVAWLAGTELAWQQRLGFLPGALSGLGIFANYTYTWSHATAAVEPDGTAPSEPEAEGFRLPGQASHTGNLALWYDHRRWSGRLALNVQSDFLLQAADPEDAESQLIYGASTQLDATLGFKISPHFTVFAEGMNLLNTPLRYFTGDLNHPSKLEYYGAWGRLGVKIVW